MRILVRIRTKIHAKEPRPNRNVTMTHSIKRFCDSWLVKTLLPLIIRKSTSCMSVEGWIENKVAYLRDHRWILTSEEVEWKSGRQRAGVPVGLRTTVQTGTRADFTSGFGKGPGVAPPLWPSYQIL